MMNMIYNNRDIIVKYIDTKEFKESNQTMPQVMPLQLGMPDEKGIVRWWLLPYEPLISISGENIVKMRNVAKSPGRGTIKERWCEGDMKISIQGTFVNDNDLEYLNIELEKLRAYGAIKSTKTARPI